MSDTQETIEPTPLAELFDGTPETPAPEPEAEATGADQDVNEEAAPEADVPDQKEDVTPTSEESTPTVPVAALQDERRKRQELQDQVADLSAKLDDVTNPRPDPYEDPEGADAWDKARTDKLTEKFEAKTWNEKVEASKVIAMRVYDDYADVEQVFMEAAHKDQALAVGLRQSASPALYAYEQGKALMQQQQVTAAGGLEQYVAQQVAEALAKQTEKQPVQDVPDAPKSLADATSAAPRDSGTAWEGPKPLDQLIPE